MEMHFTRQQFNAAVSQALLYQVDQNTSVREVIARSLTPEDQAQILDWAKQFGGVAGKGMSDRELDVLRESMERSQNNIWQRAIAHSREAYEKLTRPEQQRHRTLDASYRLVAQSSVLAFRDDSEKLKDFVQLQKNADVILTHLSLSGEFFKDLTAEQKKLFLEQIRINAVTKTTKFEGVFGRSGPADRSSEHSVKAESSGPSRVAEDLIEINAARGYLALEDPYQKGVGTDPKKQSLLEGLREILEEISEERLRAGKSDEKKKKNDEEREDRTEHRSAEQMHRFEARLPFVNSLTFENEQMTHLTSRDYAKVMSTREFVEVVRGFINQFSNTEIQDAIDRKMSYNPKIREALDALDVAVVM